MRWPSTPQKAQPGELMTLVVSARSSRFSYGWVVQHAQLGRHRLLGPDQQVFEIQQRALEHALLMNVVPTPILPQRLVRPTLH